MRAKVIDKYHLELENEFPIKNGDVFIKIVEDNPIESLRGAWGYDVDSADFVEKIRKSNHIDSI